MNSYELTDRDAELVSAYMDNQLDAEQRSALEARLAAEPDLRRELRSLQQTVALVREMPTLRAPRDFTLTPDMVQPAAPQVLPSTSDALRLLPRRNAWQTALGTAAAIVLVMVGAVFVLNRMDSTQPDDNVQVAGVPTTMATVGALPMQTALTADTTLAEEPAGMTQARQADGVDAQEEEAVEEELEEAVEEAAENDGANDSLGFAPTSDSDLDDTSAFESETFDAESADEVAPAILLPTQTQPDTFSYAATPAPTQSVPETGNIAAPESDTAPAPPLADEEAGGSAADSDASIMSQQAVPETALTQQKLDFGAVLSTILGEIYQSSEAIDLVTAEDGQSFTVQDLFDAIIGVSRGIIHTAGQLP